MSYGTKSSEIKELHEKTIQVEAKQFDSSPPADGGSHQAALIICGAAPQYPAKPTAPRRQGRGILIAYDRSFRRISRRVKAVATLGSSANSQRIAAPSPSLS